MADEQRPISRERVLRALALDALAIEVIALLAADGVESLLLKGPVLARALYRDGTRRAYADCDILIPYAQLAQAGQALTAKGFECAFDEQDADALLKPHAQMWSRPTRPWTVDLHFALNGVHADPETLWREFSGEAETIELHGTRVTAPGPSRIALLVAVHAAIHGRAFPKPIEDLRRAIEGFELDVWEAAGELAARLRATDAFVSGLGLSENGRALAEALGLSANPGAELTVRLELPPPGAIALARVLDTPGLLGKGRALRAHAFPPASYMRFSFPLARRGVAGLLAAYVQRVATRIPRIPAAINAIRAARSS